MAILAPCAVQFTNMHFAMSTAECDEPRTTTANAPPLLFEATPVAPQATVTELLVKTQFRTLRLDRATLLTYTAPPPPLARPGRVDDELVKTEQLKKVEFKMKKTRLVPPNDSLFGGDIKPEVNSETWAE